MGGLISGRNGIQEVQSGQAGNPKSETNSKALEASKGRKPEQATPEVSSPACAHVGLGRTPRRSCEKIDLGVLRLQKTIEFPRKFEAHFSRLSESGNFFTASARRPHPILMPP
jgi:hypothetical protein